MRLTIWISGALLVFASQASTLGCGGGDSAVTCDETGCDCTDRSSCDLDCDDVIGCQPTCLAFGSLCSATCLDDCEFRCRQGNDCDALCGDNCYTQCSSIETCRVEAGAGSEYRCLNATNCAADIGDDSSVLCTSVGSCSARCSGTCIVACVDTVSCSVECQQGERLNCGQGLFTCGMPCP